MAAAREPSMEDILASIKRVIAEEKEIRAAAPPPAPAPDAAIAEDVEDDVLELEEVVEEQLGPPIDLGPPLVGDDVADSSRMRLEELASVAAAAPPPVPAANPLEELVREMLRPILKQWLDDYLPHVVDEHVKREINRITGKPV
jgi:cell pole-organizing protein PopZ